MPASHQYADERCELQLPGGQDCGETATGRVMATPSPIAAPKPFYACSQHLSTLARDLRAAGFTVTT
jgi:hypothetical protein